VWQACRLFEFLCTQDRSLHVLAVYHVQVAVCDHAVCAASKQRMSFLSVSIQYAGVSLLKQPGQLYAAGGVICAYS
jgi:hypothetical protein